MALKVRWLPTTKAGRVAVWAAAAFVVLVLVNVLIVGPSTAGTDDGRSALDLAVVWAEILAALAAAVAALLAILRHGERALLVFASLLPAALVIVLEVGELLLGG